jgi:hypothetical protein
MSPVAYLSIAARRLVPIWSPDKRTILILWARHFHAFSRPHCDQLNHLDLRE